MNKLDVIIKNNNLDNKYINTVNSKVKDIDNNTVNSNDDLAKRISSFIDEQNIKPEGVAKHISELLDDTRSLPFYILLVKEHNQGILLDLAYQVRERARQNLINTKKPIYFIGILRKKGFKTKFKI